MMDRATAEEAITSMVADTRLAGARYFARHALSGDIVRLNKVLATESVPWIKRALERAVAKAKALNSAMGSLQNVSAASMSQDAATDPPARLVSDLRAEAIEEVAQTILHEFAPIIGALRLRAREEIDNYEDSRTRGLLDLLSDLLDAVRSLKRAAEAPNIEQFDLSEVVSSTVDSLKDIAEGIEIHVAGQTGFLVSADRKGMRLALVNGLRNAVEAVRQSSRTEPPQITINWGRGGVEDWLVVLDTGEGFPGDPEAALKLGVTNKQGHIGYGLATAQFAMRSMQGDVLLSNDPRGGARFELRWDGNNANSSS